jgi:hypothetical protein
LQEFPEKTTMDAFTVSFWKESVSKDDSIVELHELHEAGLVHATVNRTNHSDSTRYAIDLEDEELKKLYGRIVLAKSSDNKWKVVSALNSIEDIFLQLTEAIESAEVNMES